MTRNPRLAAFLLSLSLAACTHTTPPPTVVVHADRADHTGGLTVTGTATIGVAPDCADLSLTITREAPQPGDAIAQVQARQTALVAALRAQGVAAADLTLSQLSVDPVYDYVDSRAVLRGFQARLSITATTRRFDQIGPLMQAAAGAGATEMSNRFRRSDLESMKKDVRARAIAAAQAKAKETASALGISLARINTVAESNQSYLFTNEYFPSAGGSNAALAGDLQPLTIDVTITYDLG